MLSQDTDGIGVAERTQADRKSNLAVYCLWADALPALVSQSFHAPLSFIRHDILKKVKNNVREHENGLSNTKNHSNA